MTPASAKISVLAMCLRGKRMRRPTRRFLHRGILDGLPRVLERLGRHEERPGPRRDDKAGYHDGEDARSVSKFCHEIAEIRAADRHHRLYDRVLLSKPPRRHR